MVASSIKQIEFGPAQPGRPRCGLAGRRAGSICNSVRTSPDRASARRRAPSERRARARARQTDRLGQCVAPEGRSCEQANWRADGRERAATQAVTIGDQRAGPLKLGATLERRAGQRLAIYHCAACARPACFARRRRQVAARKTPLGRDGAASARRLDIGMAEEGPPGSAGGSAGAQDNAPPGPASFGRAGPGECGERAGRRCNLGARTRGGRAPSVGPSIKRPARPRRAPT